MTVALRKPMSPEQFLAWEERQPLRYEFDGHCQVSRGWRWDDGRARLTA
jgi:hypothetical protein